MARETVTTFEVEEKKTEEVTCDICRSKCNDYVSMYGGSSISKYSQSSSVVAFVDDSEIDDEFKERFHRSSHYTKEGHKHDYAYIGGPVEETYITVEPEYYTIDICDNCFKEYVCDDLPDHNNVNLMFDHGGVEVIHEHNHLIDMDLQSSGPFIFYTLTYMISICGVLYICSRLPFVKHVALSIAFMYAMTMASLFLFVVT